MQKVENSNHLRASFNSTYFYKISYKPNKTYLDDLNLSLEKYTIIKKSPWVYLTPIFSSKFLTIFWKIHISSNFNSRLKILELVSNYCISKNVSFKFLQNDTSFLYLNGKDVSRVSAGKFITIYPTHYEEFITMLNDLSNLLKEFEGPYILTDKSYYNSKCVYYRYGEHYPISIPNEFGTLDNISLDNNNNIYKDVRKPYFSLPKFVKDIHNDNSSLNTDSVLLKKYTPIKPIYFSSAGGVYLMKDSKNNTYIVKEARYLCGIDSNHVYSSERLKNEFIYLKDLEEYNFVPKAHDFIEDNNNIYLIEEYLDAITLREYANKHNPLLKPNVTYDALDNYLYNIINILDQIMEIFLILEKKELCIVDISFNNIMIDSNNKVYLIDLEFCRNENDSSIAVFTPGFNTNSENLKANDKIKLARLALACVFPNTYILDSFPSKYNEFINLYIENYNESKNLILLLSYAFYLNKYPFESISKIKEHKKSTDIKIINTKSIAVDKNYIEIFISSFLKNYSLPTNSYDPFFPADPNVYITNPYSLAHGIFGILYALKIIYPDNTHIKTLINDSMTISLNNILTPKRVPIGLFMGYSGIAWSLLKIGNKDLAALIFNKKVLNNIPENDGIFYGKAGVILTSLKLYLETKSDIYLNYALKIFERIIPQDIQENSYGEGTSGVALSILYIYLITKDANFINVAKDILELEINELVEVDGIIAIDKKGKLNTEKPVYSPYIYDGISGLGTVVLRFYLATHEERYIELLRKIIQSLNYKFTLFPSYMRGFSGIISFLTDCSFYLKDNNIHDMAESIIKNMLSNIDFFRMSDGENNLILGEQLYKCSFDYTTGTAGVLMQIKRLFNKKELFLNPNFFIDELLFDGDI